jgi:hypothetical protein
MFRLPSANYDSRKSRLRETHGYTTLASQTRHPQGHGADAEAPRLLLQVQYSLLPVYMYRYEAPQRTESGQLDGYINRLFVRQYKQ